MHTGGQGVPQDDVMALYWYTKAAKQGLVTAQHNPGHMYKQGSRTVTTKDKLFMANTIKGSCHCGNLKATLTTSKKPQDMWLRACQCDFCRSHNMRSLSDSEGRIEMRVQDETQLNRYHFGLNMVDFLICKNCGNYIGAVQQVDGQLFGIMNANLTENRGTQFGEANHAFYEQETGEERSARRKDVWTPATLKIA